jgi:stage IV sporulation protein A
MDVMPVMEELELEVPELVNQGSRFGVRLRASAPSLHILRANIEPRCRRRGQREPSEELIVYLLKESTAIRERSGIEHFWQDSKRVVSEG